MGAVSAHLLMAHHSLFAALFFCSYCISWLVYGDPHNNIPHAPGTRQPHLLNAYESIINNESAQCTQYFSDKYYNNILIMCIVFGGSPLPRLPYWRQWCNGKSGKLIRLHLDLWTSRCFSFFPFFFFFLVKHGSLWDFFFWCCCTEFFPYDTNTISQ